MHGGSRNGVNARERCALSDALETRRFRPVYGWLSLLVVLAPVGFFLVLLRGSGAIQVGSLPVDLPGIMLFSALLGLALSIVSIKRDEQTPTAYFALMVHGIYGLLALTVMLR